MYLPEVFNTYGSLKMLVQSCSQAWIPWHFGQPSSIRAIVYSYVKTKELLVCLYSKSARNHTYQALDDLLFVVNTRSRVTSDNMVVYSLRIRLSIRGLVAGGSVWQGVSMLCTAERFIGRVPCIREVCGFLNQWLVDPSGNGGLCHNLLTGVRPSAGPNSEK